jgi:hypothetical protein
LFSFGLENYTIIINVLGCLLYFFVGAFCILLQDFVTNEGGGEAPLEGSIPDMTSSTELVIKSLHTF